MALGNLQCGDYEVYVAERGGSTLVCRLRGITEVSYNRILNEFSECRVSVAMNADCVSALADVNPWKHELLVFRNSELAWIGPLIDLTYAPADSRIKLYARDLMAWTEKRFIELANTDYEVFDTELRDVFEWVLSHGYDKDPWDMTWELSDTGITLDRFYPGYYTPDRWGGNYSRVADELRALVGSGIDFSVVGRHMYGGDLEINPPASETLKIADHNWAKSPEIKVSGANMSNETAVAGGSGGHYGWYDDQMWIERDTASQNEYGLLQSFTQVQEMSDVYTTELPNPITQESYGRSQFLKQPVVFISGGQLAGDAPFEISDLIPGAPIEVGLVSKLRDIQTEYRLVSVEFVADETSEKISMALSLPGVEELKVGS